MRSSHFLNMSSLSFEERQFIINCFFEINKSFILVKRKYYENLEDDIGHQKKSFSTKLLSFEFNAKMFKKVF